MDQWLVRTNRNIISGPFPKDRIITLIKDGELTLQDEVCQANDYWFYLHEEGEVAQHLGINMPQDEPTDPDEEVTETQTQVIDSQAIPDGEGIPDLDEIEGELTDSTAIITNRALREFQPRKKNPGAGTTVQSLSHSAPAAGNKAAQLLGKARHGIGSSMYQPVVLGKLEKTSFWRGFALFLAGIVLTLVIIVIYVLRHV